MTTFYAQPYNIDASGFYFDSAKAYAKKATTNRDRFGMPVEEYEIQFINGDDTDQLLAKALPINQATINRFFELAETWEDHEKIRVYIAVCECGYSFDAASEDVDGLDVDLYEVDSLKELAEQFVDDGLFGEIPDHLARYIDLEAIARDLSFDYAMTDVAGMRLAYRCG